MNKSILRYWGKANPSYPGEPKWHPLAYHCLDVAAVAAVWWDGSPAIRQAFLSAFRSTEPARLRAWALFFVALHDLGKFDARFQLKAPEAAREAWPELDPRDVDGVRGFDHGPFGYACALHETGDWIHGTHDLEATARDAWCPWLAAVTGHHGDLPSSSAIDPEYAEAGIMNHDRAARAAWVEALAALFLSPPGLALPHPPPACAGAAQAMLAGFCAVCDWVGSNAETFPYAHLDEYPSLSGYSEASVDRFIREGGLSHVGLSARARSYAGVQALLKSDERPRGVQTLVDTLPPTPGLTLIEAPTGSGKTEAALACAWRLLAVGRADSIIFALPTQATANAMLKRAEAFAALAFGAANVVLAHGKRRFQPEFRRLVDAGCRRTAQGDEEAAVQCSAWLAHSRKRVFLGQIGVCTVDQTLLSVLPVRHKFVRGFGINKSVFIVDEVHAYDSYMHGLLAEVLRRQKDTGGSAILLSATLPSGVRSTLLGAWGAESPEEAPYPAVWQATDGPAVRLEVPESQRPPDSEVAIDLYRSPEAFPDDGVLAQIISAAEAGARVAIVLNLVDHAQRLLRLLRPRTAIPVDLFHARYRFVDRQAKEAAALRQYGRDGPRDGGRILIATQVVEQSVDLDFDWLITQICPVDLLFQRLGRLHRHDRPRPPGFESPRCMVISVEDEDYGYHNLIYENTRVLWRTDRLLRAGTIVFPGAYRNWIEAAYGEDFQEVEPERITRDYREFTGRQLASRQEAKQMINMPRKQYSDDDEGITIKTRDGEMSLTVMPVQADGRLLDGQALVELDDRGRAEAENLNAVPVPASWGKRLVACDRDVEGRYLLEVAREGNEAWVGQCGKERYRYTEDYGLERQ